VPSFLIKTWDAAFKARIVAYGAAGGFTPAQIAAMQAKRS
jgi:hypothetical protein